MTNVGSIQCFFVVVLFVVVVTPHGAAETSATDHRAAEILRNSLQSGGGLQQQDIQQQRTAVADHGAVEASVMVQVAQELSAEIAVTLRIIEEFAGDQEEWSQYEEQLGYFLRRTRSLRKLRNNLLSS